MNRITKTLAAAAIAFAAIGANASEVTPGDIGLQPVKAATAVALPVVKPVGIDGEVTAGDIGTRPVGQIGAPVRTATESGPAPAYSQFLIVG